MKKAAIVVGNNDPLSGGGYTFVESVLSGLRNGLINSNITVEIIYDSAQPKFPSLDDFPFDTHGVRNFGGRGFGVLGRFLIKIGLRSRNNLEHFFDRHEYGFVFFLGAPVVNLSVPYGLIIWDLQHRTHPGIPEVGSIATWNGRENAFNAALRRASLVITGTNVGKNQIIQMYGVSESVISIIPHPVKKFEKRIVIDQTNEGLTKFFYPAQFWAHKNHVRIIEAARILASKEIREFKVILSGGDKGNMEYIQKLTREYGVEDHIEFVGFISEAQLSEYYASSSVLLYASLSGPENLPPLEAFQFGLPVIISDYPGAREQCMDAARYFDPLNSYELAEIMEEVIKGRCDFDGQISRGSEIIQERTSEIFANKLLELLTRELRLRDCWQ